MYGQYFGGWGTEGARDVGGAVTAESGEGFLRKVSGWKKPRGLGVGVKRKRIHVLVRKPEIIRESEQS